MQVRVFTNPEYQFWAQTGNTWTMVRGWSSSNTYTMNNMQDGSTLVTAYAAPKADLSARTNTASNGNEDTAAAFVGSAVHVSGPATVVQGQTVTLTATSSNITPALYQFWYLAPGATTWQQSGDYGTSNTFTFTAAKTGSYKFIAYSKMPDAINNSAGAVNTSTHTATVNPSIPSLSVITPNGQTAGNGTPSSPATSLNGAAVTVSTVLTDASGNPLADTQVTFNVALNGYTAPTATSGTTVLAPTLSNGTDSTGAASMTLTGPTGVTAFYDVSASAPYQNVTAPAVDVEFVAAGQAGMAPLGTSASPYVASLGSAVPVTVTLPPVGTVAQANEQVNLTVTNGAYFTNTAGANLGSSITVYSNSVGQALTWVNDASAGNTAEVTASVSGQTYTIPSAYIEWNQAGIASTINNLTVSNASPQAGQDVTISGTVEDSAGNPVANASVLVTSNSGQGSYVSGTTTTSFPNVTVAQGVPANSTYGDVITSGANGSFSVTVTDSTVENDTFRFWSVNNGTVSSNSALGSQTLDFLTPTTLSSIVTAQSTSALATALSNQTTTVSGIQAPAGLTATAAFEPSASAKTVVNNQTLTCQLSVNNGGTINQINGVTLPSAVSAEALTVAYNASNTASPYSFSVPGDANFKTAATPGFTVGVTNTATGNTVLTVTSGSATASATEVFGAGPASQLANISPVQGSVQPGQRETLTFTVQDANGNAVENTQVPITITPGTSAPGASGLRR